MRAPLLGEGPGQLGQGNTGNKISPEQVDMGTYVVNSIGAGNHYPVVSVYDGTAWSCGWNFYGQLGRVTDPIEPADILFNLPGP